MSFAHSKLLTAAGAGLLIAACALSLALAPTRARADEVPKDGYALACPSLSLLDELLSGNFQEEHRACSLVLLAEVEASIPLRKVFGNTYDAWLASLVDEPTQTLPEVELSMMKVAGFKAYAAWPLSFVDEHWLDEDTMAQNAITFGLQTDLFESWVTPASEPGTVMVASAS